MSLKYMILGCVRESPAHGYDMLRLIFRDFAENGPEVNTGQLYTLLHRLEKEGLIVRETVPQEKAPSRKVIRLTPKGEEEFDSWLRSSAEEVEFIRYDFFSKYGFLYKVNYFHLLSTEEILEKIDWQISLMEEKLANFLAAEEDMRRRKVNYYRILILQYGIEVQKTKLAWLRKLREEVLRRAVKEPEEAVLEREFKSDGSPGLEIGESEKVDGFSLSEREAGELSGR